MTDDTDFNSSLLGQARKLQSILESAVDAIITIDEMGTITTANPAAARLFGYGQDAFLGRNVNFLMPPPYQAEHDGYLHNYRATGRRRIIGIGREVSGRRSDGSVFPMQLAVSEFEMDGRTFFTGIIHDLSAHKATELALRQAQKMEAMGQLTGGIAHDFNNLLTVIIGNLEMLEGKLTTPLQRELTSEALDAADLGARLTTRLLAFARRSHLEPESINLNSFVLGLTDMLHRTLGETIYLSSSLTPNARDAMPRGGRLVIETSNVTVSVDMATRLDGLNPGDYVQLAVSDTGEGMSSGVRERAFEPFFTTKEMGRGTGLGLSMIYGFAKQSGGLATIESTPGKGTVVAIYLPRHRVEPTLVVDTDLEGTALAGSGQTILAVEDDERVRKLTVTRLTQLGYTVLSAGSGAEAIDILAAGQPVDLLFSDVVMPGGISGFELRSKVQALYPNLPVLLTSGYAEELSRDGAAGEGPLRILNKPYRLAELAAAIDDALKN